MHAYAPGMGDGELRGLTGHSKIFWKKNGGIVKFSEGRKEGCQFFLDATWKIKYLLHYLMINPYTSKVPYYSFKIFLLFWLAKIPLIIHHNQLLLTKFGRLCDYCDYLWKMTSILQHNCQKTGQLSKKTWGWGWVVLVVSTKWWNISLV